MLTRKPARRRRRAPRLVAEALEARQLLASLALSGPASIEVDRTGSFTVTLDAPRAQPTAVHPSDGGRGGTFSADTVTIPAGQLAATFTYTPTYYGPTTISLTNDAGIAGTVAANVVAMVQLGSVNTLDGDAPDLGGWRPFSPNDPWNQDISNDPVDPNSSKYLDVIGPGPRLNVSFDTVYYGMPFVVVPGDQPYVPVDYVGGYPQLGTQPSMFPIPDNIPIEAHPTNSPPPTQLNNGDEHGIILERDEQTGGIKKIHELFELYKPNGLDSNWAVNFLGVTWDASQSATYQQRPDGYASADAAGLNIFAGLLRADEVLKLGEIDHALRITVSRSTLAHIAPALAQAVSSGNPYAAPMGLRLRLRPDFDARGLNPACQVVVEALKKYGAIVADNGPDLQLTGTRDMNWGSIGLFNGLGAISARDFQVMQVPAGYSVTPPTSLSGPSGVASGTFTVGLNGDYSNVDPSNPVTVVPMDDAGGTFSPWAVFLSAANPTATFTYTPAGADGDRNIRFVDIQVGRVNPLPITYHVGASAPAPDPSPAPAPTPTPAPAPTPTPSPTPSPSEPAWKFDFGMDPWSPTAPGYIGVGQSARYSPARGYGWAAGDVGGYDRWIGDALDRDYNYTADGTFAVDLPDGNYTLTVRMGDTGGNTRDLMALDAEGVRLDVLNARPGQVLSRSYNVKVADGQLNLRIRDLGGDPFAAIEALVIEQADGGGLKAMSTGGSSTPTAPAAWWGAGRDGGAATLVDATLQVWQPSGTSWRVASDAAPMTYLDDMAAARARLADDAATPASSPLLSVAPAATVVVPLAVPEATTDPMPFIARPRWRWMAGRSG